jgi:hypothetical protein
MSSSEARNLLAAAEISPAVLSVLELSMGKPFIPKQPTSSRTDNRRDLVFMSDL